MSRATKGRSPTLALRTDDWRVKLAERLDPAPSPYLLDPAGWVQDRLDEYLWTGEVAILESILEHRYTAVQSCHDVGKSFVAARASAWWIDAHPPGEAFVVTTAPTAAQVGAILWREIGRAHRNGKLAGYITGDNQWKIELGGPAELVGYGRKPADYDPAAFQGIHERYVLVVIDEACGVPKSIFEAADSLATNIHARVLAIGNPDDPASYFASVCRPGSGWNVILLDALRSPNFTRAAVAEHPELRSYMIREGIPPTDEWIPDRLREMLISPQWVVERLRRWGEKSPIFQSKVRGIFPTVSVDTLIHPHWVVLAQAREVEPAHVDPRMGVDVARYGTDHSIIVVRLGNHVRVVQDVAYGPITELAGFVLQHARGRENTPIVNVDDHGVGGGVTDILREEGMRVLALNSNGSARELMENGKPRFVNTRSEWWWHARELLAGETGDGTDAKLDLDPDDDELAAQLTNVKYRVNRHGQIEVESKDQMKRRGLASPDRGDAFVYSLVNDDPDDSLPDQSRMITGDIMAVRW